MVGHVRDSDEGLRHDPTVVVYLSLYLLLIAFFIVLNNISQQASMKAEQAVASVTDTFRKYPGKRDDGAFGLGRGELSGNEMFLRQVQGLFENSLPLARFTRDQRHGVLRVTVPSEAVFISNEAEFARSADIFMKRLATSLVSNDAGLRYEAEIAIGSGPVLPQGDAIAQALEMRRAGALARRLLELGAPNNTVSTGVVPGDPGVVAFSFHTRDRSSLKLMNGLPPARPAAEKLSGDAKKAPNDG
jgi:hypothetical protein